MSKLKWKINCRNDGYKNNIIDQTANAGLLSLLCCVKLLAAVLPNETSETIAAYIMTFVETVYSAQLGIIRLNV